MCSVLLILLLFVVIFDLVKDSAIQVHVEEKGQAKKGNCEKKLVFTSERSHHIELQSFERSEEYPQYAPFERPCLLVQDWGRNGCPRGHLPLEVRLLCKTQQKDSYNLPKVPITLEQGYAPQHRTERQRDSIQNGHLGCLGYLGSKCADLGRRLLELASISIDPKAAHAEPTRQERESERKGEQRKGNQREGGADVANSSPFAPLAPSLPPWPTTETSGASLFATSSVSTTAMSSGHTTQDVIAMAAALKEAYPDEKTRPDYVKVLIEKAEKETAKDVAKG
jgi:hypothetical protein